MKPKKIKYIYWIITGLFAVIMIASSIADLMRVPDAVTIMTHLGFPLYIMSFLGVAKLLGIVAILIPRFPKIKEWAYAGFVFNFAGAVYSHICIGDTAADISRPFIILVFVVISYFYYHRKLSIEKLEVELGK